MEQICEIIVVEGKADASAVRRAVDAEIIVTSGFGITGDTWQRIALARRQKGVVILTDPDHAGEGIRRRINRRVPGCKNAFMTRGEALRKGNVGIENAAPERIRSALENARCRLENSPHVFGMEDLRANGLNGSPRAARRREAMGRRLGIGYANAKQWLRRLNGYRITRHRFREALLDLDGAVEPTAQPSDRRERHVKRPIAK